jgi:microcompartment protein CcmL/EutN
VIMSCCLQIDGGVTAVAKAFDEGADTAQWQRH